VACIWAAARGRDYRSTRAAAATPAGTGEKGAKKGATTKKVPATKFGSESHWPAGLRHVPALTKVDKQNIRPYTQQLVTASLRDFLP